MSNSDNETNLSSSSDEDESKSQPGLNLAGFLFGNIDRDGQLEENFLDEASKKKLGGLSSMLGLGSLIQDEVKNAATADANVKVEDYEEGNKAPNAEDFSAINDPLTDDSSSSSSDDENDEKKTDIKAETIKKESSPISESIKTEIKPEIKSEPETEDEK